ncbi:hypothetical protein [Sandaracinus amylolyticus]|uniref:hypothetical protein n=1 Tax=Sandaracinus amylolyticus TaxID=927083 RepID=UPI001F29BE1D|nr:hypothetical protein [Sandaracinus amylolyticus]UJR83991.1 Hypothetical protein I5071_60620 [Sandaracinus amylolyticus]
MTSPDEEKLRARFAEAEDDELRLIARSTSQSALARTIARETLIARGLEAPPEIDTDAPVTTTTRAPLEPTGGPSTAALVRALIAAVIAVIALAIRCGSGG